MIQGKEKTWQTCFNGLISQPAELTTLILENSQLQRISQRVRIVFALTIEYQCRWAERFESCRPYFFSLSGEKVVSLKFRESGACPLGTRETGE
ncbi:hypothetical protein F1728_07910 [Gimesia benthica]|uniref:Uncharacterized protein n=1 Tax=Gimesia benthica TaxID=2608982 RepID=A0A6I6A989_9PLAN|nr:hypothetical protein [Gimesia benthica]QGQ22606.1 hypothetical protein F1728_07910 [Gimesia benthica]